MYFLLKMGIFHCYVSLPEGMLSLHNSIGTVDLETFDRSMVLSGSPKRLDRWHFSPPRFGKDMQGL